MPAGQMPPAPASAATGAGTASPLAQPAASAAVAQPAAPAPLVMSSDDLVSAEQPEAVPAIAAADPTSGGPSAGFGGGSDSPSSFTTGDGSQSFAGLEGRAPTAAHAAAERSEVARSAVAQVVVPLTKAVNTGLHHIEISLEPAALGPRRSPPRLCRRWADQRPVHCRYARCAGCAEGRRPCPRAGTRPMPASRRTPAAWTSGCASRAPDQAAHH